MIELYVVAHEQWFLDYPEDLVTKRAQWSLDYYDIGNPEFWNSQSERFDCLSQSAKSIMDVSFEELCKLFLLQLTKGCKNVNCVNMDCARNLSCCFPFYL